MAYYCDCCGDEMYQGVLGWHHMNPDGRCMEYMALNDKEW